MNDEQFEKLNEQAEFSQEDFDEAMGHALGFCNKLVGEKTIYPHFYLYYRKFNGVTEPLSDIEIAVHLIAIPFNEWDDKVAAINEIALHAFDSMLVPIATVLSSEAWMSTSETGMPKCMPRDDPGKREAIVVFGMDCCKRSAISYIPIDRDEEGNTRRSGSDHVGVGGESPLLVQFWNKYKDIAEERILKRRNQ